MQSLLKAWSPATFMLKRKEKKMSESRSHKITANRISKKLRADYNPDKGVDIKSSRATVEVETPDTVGDAPRQLRGHRGFVYIAGTTKGAVQKAIEVTSGTTIGVMDNRGDIIKRSTRKGAKKVHVAKKASAKKIRKTLKISSSSKKSAHKTVRKIRRH